MIGKEVTAMLSLMLQMGGFCLVEQLAPGGSVNNRAIFNSFPHIPTSRTTKIKIIVKLKRICVMPNQWHMLFFFFPLVNQRLSRQPHAAPFWDD